jgi:FkbM family methyltransferase
MRHWLATRLRAGLAHFGLQLRRLPSPLARCREAELRLRLEHVIAHHLLHHQPIDFFFIQVGAFDGLANDPLHDLIVRFKWRGILLEPQQEAFKALAATYHDQPQLSLVNAAIAERSGFRPLYKLRRGAPDLPAWAPQVASFRRETVVKHGDVIRGIEDLVETELVPCVSFDDLPLPAAATVDLLQIDAEGSDFEVIRVVSRGRAQGTHHLLRAQAPQPGRARGLRDLPDRTRLCRGPRRRRLHRLSERGTSGGGGATRDPRSRWELR